MYLFTSYFPPLRKIITCCHFVGFQWTPKISVQFGHPSQCQPPRLALQDTTLRQATVTTTNFTEREFFPLEKSFPVGLFLLLYFLVVEKSTGVVCFFCFKEKINTSNRFLFQLLLGEIFFAVELGEISCKSVQP